MLTTTRELSTDTSSSRQLPTYDKAVTIERFEERFMYCLRIQKLAAFCCCHSMTLRRGLYIVVAVEFVSAALALLALIFGYGYQNGFLVGVCSVQLMGVLIGSLAFLAASKFNLGAARTVYNWMIWEPMLLDIMQFLGMVTAVMDRDLAMDMRTFAIQMVATSAMCIGRLFYGMYSTYLLYSFILLTKKGCRRLVQYGPDAYKEMERVQTQAAVMNLCPEKVEHGHVIDVSDLS